MLLSWKTMLPLPKSAANKLSADRQNVLTARIVALLDENKDGRTERLEIEAASLFDAGYRALQQFAVMWWDSSKPITVKCNGQAWQVRPDRLSEWKCRQGGH